MGGGDLPTGKEMIMSRREPMPIGCCHEVVIDCANPRGLAEFWRSVLGGEIYAASEKSYWVALVGANSIRRLAFQRVPEDKTVKNRVHLDIAVRVTRYRLWDAVCAEELLGDKSGKSQRERLSGIVFPSEPTGVKPPRPKAAGAFSFSCLTPICFPVQWRLLVYEY